MRCSRARKQGYESSLSALTATNMKGDKRRSHKGTSQSILLPLHLSHHGAVQTQSHCPGSAVVFPSFPFSFFFFFLLLQFLHLRNSRHIPNGVLARALVCARVSPLPVPVCLYVRACVTLSGAFPFNHLGEISNIPLKLNMKGNLLYFYLLSLCREPGNYLFHSASDLWKAHE